LHLRDNLQHVPPDGEREAVRFPPRGGSAGGGVERNERTSMIAEPSRRKCPRAPTRASSEQHAGISARLRLACDYDASVALMKGSKRSRKDNFMRRCLILPSLSAPAKLGRNNRSFLTFPDNEAFVDRTFHFALVVAVLATYSFMKSIHSPRDVPLNGFQRRARPFGDPHSRVHMYSVSQCVRACVRA